jgi:predicted MFS family arabinose efflux permease
MTSGSLWAPQRRGLTVGLVLTITLVATESLAIAAAMPIVARDLGGADLYGWVFSAFFLGSLMGIAVVGAVIDDRGMVLPFTAGLVLFAAGLLVGGLAPSMPVLIAARFVQGLGGGAVPPIAYVAIGRALPTVLRPRMFATLSTAWVLPGIFGPGVAGFVAEALHWRFVFLGLLPLLAVSGTIAFRALGAAEREHPPGRRAGATTGRRHRRTLVLAAGVAAGTGLLTAGLPQPDPLAAALLAGPGLLLTVAAFRALTPPGTLSLRRGYPAAILLRGVTTFAFFAIDPYVTLLLVDVRGWSAALAGLGLTGATVLWSVGAWVQARLSSRRTPDRFVQAGLPIIGVGIALTGLALLPAVPAVVAVPAFSFAAFGMGLAYSQYAIVVLRDAPVDAQGVSSAALSLSDGLGSALGTGVTSALLAASIRDAGTGAGTATGLGRAIAVSVAVAAVGALLAHRLRHPDAPRPIDASGIDAPDAVLAEAGSTGPVR